MSLRAAPIAALLACTVSSGTAAELYCRQTGHVNWADGTPIAFANAEGDWGGSEIWLNTSTGDWRQRFIGSRALYTDGGTFEVLNDGSGYRADWVGITPELAEMMRINLRQEPSPYVRVLRGQAIETGLCIDPGQDTYIDGELVQ